MEGREMNFGELLREYRETNGVLQEELSKATGICMNQIRNYEKGKAIPKVDTIVILAHAMDMAPETLCRAAVRSVEENIRGLY